MQLTVTPSFAALAASRLAPGAAWRLATDWSDYVAQMVEVLDAEPLLSGGHSQVTQRDRIEEYMSFRPCPVCKGARLNPASLSVLINGRSIAEVSAMPLQETKEIQPSAELQAKSRRNPNVRCTAVDHGE